MGEDVEIVGSAVAHMPQFRVRVGRLDAIEHASPDFRLAGPLATGHAMNPRPLPGRTREQLLRPDPHDLPILGVDDQGAMQEEPATMLGGQTPQPFPWALVAVVDFRRVADHQVRPRE